MRVNLSKLPDPRKEYVIRFPRLDGGLNNWEPDYRLQANESPELKNLWWQDGALCCRDGQIRLTAGEGLGVGHSAYETLFHGHGFFHIGSGLYCGKLGDEKAAAGSVELALLLEGVPENPGSWFRYTDCLYYKNRGGYCRIGLREDMEPETEGHPLFLAEAVPAYTPVIQINTEPLTAAGDLYQPENRISPRKTVEYSTVEGVKEYHLPVQEIGSVDRVTVDGVELPEITMEEMRQIWAAQEETEGETEPQTETRAEGDAAGEGESTGSQEPEEIPTATCYAVEPDKGIVWFDIAPRHHEPVQVNTVDITYTRENPDAYSSIMDCDRAIVYGGNQNLCVVLGGCPAQPNAYYWCGNHIVMDPGYFPMEQYNFAGETAEPITGFGRQQSMLVIFKERSVGRSAMSTTQMQSGRVLITMDYVSINSEVGCDLPGSIRLIENNLVFANTRQGVYRVADSSSAYENNIVPISRKVNNSLLKLVRENRGAVCSFDDGARYWLCAAGEVYAWDYALSTWKDPSWFYFTDIPAISFLMDQSSIRYHLGGDGQVSMLLRSFADYDGPIEKVFRFATQDMGSYRRLKDITGAVFSVRGDTDTELAVEYQTDYERRFDLTPIRSYTWRLAPRNLAYRYLGVRRFATVAKRRPGCRHVRHFTVKLSNNKTGMDMAVLSAEIFYKFSGRER